MRVALTIPELVGGGAERVFVDLAAGLVDAGCAVDMVVVRAGGRLESTLPATVRLVPLDSGTTAGSVPALRRYLRDEKPQGVISALSHMNLVTIAAAKSARYAGALVVTQHNTLSMSTAHARNRRDRSLAPLLKLGYPFADQVVAVSGGVADDLADTTGLSRERIAVVFNPVVFDRLIQASEEPIDHPWAASERYRVVLAVGRLTAQKDFAGLLHALAELDTSYRLVLLGEGPERRPLELLAEKLGLHDRVFFAGFVSNPYPWFRCADVFALSSAWEGLPTVLIEALAFPAAIVSTDCKSGPREILESGRWGRLVPVRNPKRLAQAIDEAAAEGPAHRPAALHPYALATVTQRYLELLRQPGRRHPATAGGSAS